MSSKVSKVKIANAFQAMKAIGISEDKVKPVLKKLLKLYDKNWELIEAENYRALADAIFEREETQAAELPQKIENNEVAERSKKIVNSEKDDEMEGEAQANQRALKRLRHRYQDGETSSLHMSNTGVSRASLIRPKEEPDELPESLAPMPNGSEDIVESSEPTAEKTGIKSHPITSESLGNNAGKQPVNPESSNIQSDPSQPNGISRSRKTNLLRSEFRSPVHPMRLRGRSNESDRSTHSVRLKEKKAEPGIVSSPKQSPAVGLVLLKPKDEPITDDMPAHVADPLTGVDSSRRDGTIRGDDGPQSTLQSPSQLEINDGTASPDEPRDDGMAEMPSGAELIIETPMTIDVTPTIVLSSKSCATDANGAKDPCFSSLNESADSQSNVNLPLSTRPSHCNGMDDGSQLNKIVAGDESGTGKGGQENHSEQTKKSLVVVQHPQVGPEMIRLPHDVVDIARGHEKVVITLVNEVNNERPPSFYYIPRNAIFQNAYMNFALARIGDNNSCASCVGDCLSLDTPCACSHETGGEFAYTSDGLVKEDLLKESISMNRDPKKHCQFFCKECPLERSKNEDSVEPCKGHLVRKFIKECWLKCGCSKSCGNRVVQRGITRNLQVFMTPGGKGWGLRTLEELPKGAFVCEYVGEVLTNAELFDRVQRSSEGEKHSYPVLLDADWCAEGVLKDEDALCLDATYYGNVARFINHRCYDSNLVEIPVEVETPDHHYYHLAFFTTRKVKAMEELTWDYGIDFDDLDHPIKAFRCQCGSKFCRNIKRSRSRGGRR